MKDKMEFEQSVYSDWELEDQRQQQLIKDIEVISTSICIFCFSDSEFQI